ncbi:bifunctional 3-(3-hydroxy-phenyl)propionate/3-hydroxycinnamic acid hydroxylase MhpA [Glaciibacter sp. 2TAF33]|uniref:bifunctional 3-(3-hydroxy-phenyl)propionate/3-hydroxycinnamic acid hydroxylase MhpA n=1 Tax=Glaciibacter sp. 2TAF33 TaxID=3233015 RepID=UPI003F90E597
MSGAETEPSVDVAIIGLGPTGAVLANILGAAGARVAVFDREPAPLNLPRAVHFDGEVMRVFQSIGLADEILKVIRLSRGVRYYSASGELLMERRPPAVEGTHIWTDKNMFHQPDLEQVLRQGVERYPTVDVRALHEVLSVDDQEAGAALDVRDLATGEVTTWRASWVVGSDGGRSLLRRTIGSELEDFGLHDPWLVVDIELLDDVELPDCTVQYCDPARPTTYVHVTGNRRRWEFKILPDDDMDTFTSDENVWSLLSRWVAPGQAVLVRHAVYTFHALIAEKWREGRLLLAGDSAHQTPPFLGQGMCTGIRDAANLGWKLALVSQGADSALLDTYESERRPHSHVFIQTAARLGGIIQTTDPAKAAERDAQMLAGGTIDFRDPAPPLGPGLHDGGAFGGRIEGQPRLSTGEPLDEVVGSRFAVLATSRIAGAPALSERAAETGAVWLQDPALDAWLEQRGVQALVLRPDRYVLGGATDAVELAALLDMVPRTPMGTHVKA